MNGDGELSGNGVAVGLDPGEELQAVNTSAAAATQGAYLSRGMTVVPPQRPPPPLNHRADASRCPDRTMIMRHHRRALRFVREWAALHQSEILTNWDRACRNEPPLDIPPLP